MTVTVTGTPKPRILAQIESYAKRAFFEATREFRVLSCENEVISPAPLLESDASGYRMYSAS